MFISYIITTCDSQGSVALHAFSRLQQLAALHQVAPSRIRFIDPLRDQCVHRLRFAGHILGPHQFVCQYIVTC